MSRKTALQLRFALGDYLVTWQLPSMKGGTFPASGALTLEAGKPPEGTAHGELDDALKEMTKGVVGFPQHIDLPTLSGHLSNGANILLINARIDFWAPTQARISANAAVITLAEIADIDEVSFKFFEIQIGGLDAIAGAAPIKSTNFPTKGVTGNWSAELHSDSGQEWSDTGATMKLAYHGSFRLFDPYAFSMSFSPVLSCELAEAVPLRQLLDEWVTPLRRVISIATGRPEEITFLSVRPVTSDGGKYDGQLFGSGITQDPYESTREEVEKTNSPLRLKPDDVSLLSLVRTWQKLVATRHPLIETYGSMLHALDQHPRSRFLLLLQAIEGTHGHETKESFKKRQKKHSDEREELVEIVKDYLNEKQLKFLERNLGKRPPGGLESAINWLSKKLPGDLKKDLDSTDLVTTTRSEPINARDAPDALRIIRNNLAHGTKGYDAYELYRVVEVLEQAVRAHALELLGCSDGIIGRVLKAT
ncbi:ApeA N-terminal domain 1-containing protein [Amycolatopsis thailandensis]|uniref:ApeA N-terminal domain 1-containing protein n=1 Tax=Amycolatopsis thailandensis TaxID=589330 RepID=UPI003635FC11